MDFNIDRNSIATGESIIIVATKGIGQRRLYEVVASILVAGSMIFAAGIAAVMGDGFLCGNLFFGTSGILTVSLSGMSKNLGGYVAAIIFSSYQSDAASICEHK